MDKNKLLKAIADDTRMNILTLLLRHNYCVRALANELNLSEATISQHLKVLREAGVLVGENVAIICTTQLSETFCRNWRKRLNRWLPSKRKSVYPKLKKTVPPTISRNAIKKANVTRKRRKSVTVKI